MHLLNCTLHGATVLSTGEARAVWDRHSAAFIDVLPQAPRPAGLPASTIWREKPREYIPSSIWLPDTGYGRLSAGTEEYLKRGLAHATGGNQAALQAQVRLEDQGLLGIAIRPPTVPEGEARLRLSFSAAHSAADVTQLCDALAGLEPPR